MARHACLRQTAQHIQPVQLGQDQIHQQYVRLQFPHHGQRLLSVGSNAHDLHAPLGGDPFAEQLTEIHVGVCQQDADFGFHNIILPILQCAGKFGLAESRLPVMSQ